jgi:hypothetical protein
MWWPIHEALGEKSVRLALQPQLVVFEALPQLLVRDRELPALTDVARIDVERGALGITVLTELWRRGRVMTVAVDDHRGVIMVVLLPECQQSVRLSA